METLYRKVAVNERLPKNNGYYLCGIFYEEGLKEIQFSNKDGFYFSYPIEYWFEEIPDNSHQIEKLEADKAELLEALEVFFPMFTELDSEFGIENPHPRKWTETEIATVQKLFDLIQKMKQ